MTDKTKSSKSNSMKLRNGKKYETKKCASSSSDDGDSWIDDETYDEEEEEMDMKDFRKLLSNIFPSKYINEKTKNTPSSKKRKADADEVPDIIKSMDKYYSGNYKRRDGKKIKQESDEEEEDEVYSKPGKINIIFTMGGKYDDEDDDSEEDDSDYYDEEDDDECEECNCEGECDCDEEEEEEDEDGEDDDEEEEDDDEEEDEEEKNIDISKKKSSKEKMSDEDILKKFKEMTESLSVSGNKNNAIVKQLSGMTKKLEDENKKKQEKAASIKKMKNVKQFKKMLKINYITNDSAFFKNKLNYDEQCLILKEMESIHKLTRVEKPYRLTLLETNIPTRFKSCALRRLNQLRYMEPGSGEYYKIKNWIDTFMEIPFGVYNTLPVTLSDGVEKCHDFMDEAKNCLDKEVFGLNDAKMQIMQMIGQWIANPDAVGTAIAIQGPMGTGKTTLIKDGISKILNREFAFIALGGATDSSFLEGHSYTYEGSTWGKIVDILIQCKSMNPIIYFDELDKVSDTPKGEEIIGILTHLTDTSQNSKFHDKYFSEIDFDLSKCLFIFSYNDESKVNPILKDRMYRIHTSGYNKNEKTTIAKDYLLPKIMEQVKFEPGQINIPDETLHTLIDNYTQEENGVRNLKRCLEIIYTKLNLYRLMKPGSKLFEEELSLDVKFPLDVTVDIVTNLIKKKKESVVPYGMYT